MNTVLFFKFFAGLMAIMNPLIALPVFISLTKDDSKTRRVKVALYTSISILLILTMSAYSGKAVLSVFGISIGGFQVAGGVLVGIISLNMMYPKPAGVDQEKHMNPAIVPLALPIMAGPGTISKTIVFASNAHGMSDFDSIILAIACGCALTFIILASSEFLSRVMGKTGITTITKIMALILGAISVEMIVGGIKAEFLLGS